LRAIVVEEGRVGQVAFGRHNAVAARESQAVFGISMCEDIAVSEDRDGRDGLLDGFDFGPAAFQTGITNGHGRRTSPLSRSIDPSDLAYAHGR
jgi:hypothetical protein